jgi:hypothetical protein
MNKHEAINSIELPKYTCHKQVWALKIAKIDKYEFLRDPATGNKPDNYYTLFPENKRYGPFNVDEKYWNKHHPQIGGYYVQYKDGYQSYSPSKEFEDGYTLN